MKKRVAGGVVLVAIGVGIWLSNLFTGLGPGGAGTNLGLSPNVQVSADNSDAVGGGPVEEDAETIETSTSVETMTQLPDQPIVLIDDTQYYLEGKVDENVVYRKTTLEEIANLVKASQPDEHGIRVYIKRRGSSRPSAETGLQTTLRDAGVAAREIHEHYGFVE